MTLSTQQSDEDSQFILVAKVDNARNVSNVLKAVHFKDKEVGPVSNDLWAARFHDGFVTLSHTIMSPWRKK